MRFIQGKFVNSKKARTVEDISKVFATLVFQGKLSAAIKLLDSENSTGLLNLTPDVLERGWRRITRKQQISRMRVYYMGTLLHSSWRFWLERRENDLWCCNQNKGLSWAVGDGYRAIHKKSVKDRLLPIFAGRLYLLQTHPLGQNPGIRPIGVAEVLRRTVGKTIAGFLKEELKRQRAPFRIAQAIAQAQRPR